MSVTLAAYRPGLDDPEVLQLRARVWGADHPHTSAAFLAWLFQHNPAGPGSGVLLRRHDTLIGFAGLHPRLAVRNGETFRVAHGLDFMVDPEASRGLSGAYAVKVAAAWSERAAAQGYAFGVNFPNANSYRLLTSKRLGWRRVLAPRLLVRPLPGLRLREGLPARLPARLVDLGGAAAARALSFYAWARRGPRRETQRVTDFDWLDGSRTDGTGIGFVADAALLNWRYRDHPVYRYRVFACEGPGHEATGLVTSARALFGVDSVLIVDLVGHERLAACAALVASAVEDAAANGARIVGALACAGTVLSRALMQAGFVAVPTALNPKPFYMVAHPLGGAGEAFAEAPWRFAWGDMDVV